MHAESDCLRSDRGIEYTQLRNSLASGNWREADLQTYIVMLQVLGREEGARMRDEDWRNFACTDLQILDRLWVKYSDGQFGFSIQKSLFASLEGTPTYDKKAWLEFGERVGWHLDGKWQVYDRLNFSIDAPAGCFPVFAIAGRAYSIISPGFWAVRNIAALSQRLIDCRI